MKKIKHYTGNSLDFYVNVRDSKQDANLKASLVSIHSNMTTLYESYDSAFATTKLHTLAPDASLGKKMRADLLSLYKYNAVPFQHLLNILTTNEHNQVDDACPYCNLNTASTFDHILPKSVFQEFAVHPLNLIPCCHDCNGHKSSNWVHGNALKYLNLYQDEMPNAQYLFVKFTITDGLPLATFYLKNTGNIDSALYDRINATYRALKLCRLYQRRCSEEICEIAIFIQQGIARGTSVEQIKAEMIEDVRSNRIRKGYNYWKAVLKEACCNDAVAFQSLATAEIFIS